MSEDPIFICPLVTCGAGGALDYFVSPGGSDSGSGTLADPLATVREALARIRNQGWDVSATIHLLPGDNLLGDGLVSFEAGAGRKLNALRIVGTLAPVATVTVAAVTLAPSGAMDIDIGVPAAAYSGLRASFSGGAFAVAGGGSGTVLSFPSVAPAAAPVPTSSITFSVPAARLVCGPGGNTFVSSTPLSFENFDFVLPDVTGGFFAALMLNVTLVASYLRITAVSGAGGIIFTGGQFASGQDSLPSIMTGALGLGSVPGGPPIQLIAQNCTLALGRAALQNFSVTAQQSAAFVGSGLFQGCYLESSAGSTFSVDATAIRDAPSDGIFVHLAAASVSAAGGATEIDNCSGDGIGVDGGFAEVGAGVSGANAGRGAYIRWNGRATAWSFPTVTGGAGDVQVGALPAAAWASGGASDFAAPAPEFAALAVR